MMAARGIPKFDAGPQKSVYQYCQLMSVPHVRVSFPLLQSAVLIRRRYCSLPQLSWCRVFAVRELGEPTGRAEIVQDFV